MSTRSLNARAEGCQSLGSTTSTSDASTPPAAQANEVSKDDPEPRRMGSALATWLWSDRELRLTDDERQDVWLRLRDREMNSDDGCPASRRLIATIVKHLRIDARRRQAYEESTVAELCMGRRCVPAIDPSVEAERRELLKLLFAALRALPASQRAVLVHAVLEIEEPRTAAAESEFRDEASSRKRTTYLLWDARRRLALVLQPYFDQRLRSRRGGFE